MTSSSSSTADLTNQCRRWQPRRQDVGAVPGHPLDLIGRVTEIRGYLFPSGCQDNQGSDDDRGMGSPDRRKVPPATGRRIKPGVPRGQRHRPPPVRLGGVRARCSRCGLVGVRRGRAGVRGCGTARRVRQLRAHLGRRGPQRQCVCGARSELGSVGRTRPPVGRPTFGDVQSNAS
jgi:hypothetical protein